jgi:tRNA uridine 5-carboxymethylaminomethyl modification enzyme
LTDIGHRLGLVSDSGYRQFERKRIQVEEEVRRLNETRLSTTSDVRNRMSEAGISEATPGQTLAHLLRRQGMTYETVQQICGDLPVIVEREVIEAIELEIKYEGYINRQVQQIQKAKRLEERRIPVSFNYDQLPGFSREVLEKLKKIRPASVGQASRISGVTPAAISLLLVGLERTQRIVRNSVR